MHVKPLFAGLLLLLSSSVLLAQDASPDVFIKNVTEEVLSVVRQDKEIQNGSTRKAIALVENKVLPNFNFQRMTALAMGRDWNKATPQQKERLAEEFKTLLMRTYSNALTSYKNQTVVYKPTKLKGDESDVVVRTEIVQPGNKAIPLDYAVVKQGNDWKIYDVLVSGISLVTNYRETFSREIRSNGIDGLIEMLANKNKQLEVGKK
ncbi:MAG: ABC transporter substrate-binding protein [Pseudomonadota bacterium]